MWQEIKEIVIPLLLEKGKVEVGCKIGGDKYFHGNLKIMEKDFYLSFHQFAGPKPGHSGLLPVEEILIPVDEISPSLGWQKPGFRNMLIAIRDYIRDGKIPIENRYSGWFVVVPPGEGHFKNISM